MWQNTIKKKNMHRKANSRVLLYVNCYTTKKYVYFKFYHPSLTQMFMELICRNGDLYRRSNVPSAVL